MAKAYKANITGLRAVAVMTVTLYHLTHFLHPQLTWFSGGFVGVDIFLVISGYLMTMIIMRGIAEHRFSLYDFYKRRAQRICPALFITVLLVVTLGYVLIGTEDLIRLCREGLSALLFVANIYFATQTDYFANIALDQPLLHTWSLAVEWQFYLIYPLLLLGLRYLLAPRYLARLLLVAAALGLTYACYYAGIKPQAAYYLLPSRIFEFLVGAVAYCYPLSSVQAQVARTGAGAVNAHGKREIKAWSLRGWWLQPWLWELTGLTLIVLSFVLIEQVVWPNYGAILPLGGAYLCLAADNERTFLRWQPLQWLGMWSYAIYLVHWPLLVLLTKLGFTLSDGWILLLILLCGMSLHYLWEQRRNYGYILVGGYALLAAACAYGNYTYVSFRLENEITRYAQYGGHGVPFDGEIRLLGDPERRPDFILIGDSFARHYTLDLLDRGLTVLTVLRDGCYSFAYHVNIRPEGVLDQKCQQRYDAARRAVALYPDLPVVVAQDWTRYQQRLLQRGPNGQTWPKVPKVKAEDFAAALEQDFLALVKDFAPHQVYVLGTPRQTVFDIGSTCAYQQAIDTPLNRMLSKYVTCRRFMELQEPPFNQQLMHLLEALPRPTASAEGPALPIEPATLSIAAAPVVQAVPAAPVAPETAMPVATSLMAARDPTALIAPMAPRAHTATNREDNAIVNTSAIVNSGDTAVADEVVIAGKGEIATSLMGTTEPALPPLPISPAPSASHESLATVHYLDPSDAICSGDLCEVLVGAYVPVFQDGLHYSWGGSVKVMSYILSQIGVPQGRIRLLFEDEIVSPENVLQPLYAPDAKPLKESYSTY